MGEDGTFYKGVFLMALFFGTGFGVGYKVKSTANIKTVTDFAAFSIKDTYDSSFFLPGKRVADGMVEEEKGAAGGEAARNSERNRTHENQLKLS